MTPSPRLVVCRVCGELFPVWGADPGRICSDACGDIEEAFEAKEEAARKDDTNDQRGCGGAGYYRGCYCEDCMEMGDERYHRAVDGAESRRMG
jgi:hypothetical protein